MAEHIARKKFGEHIEVASAGLFPGSTEDAHNAIFTLRNLFNVDASNHKPKDVRTMAIDTFDLVVAMDNQVATQVQKIFPSIPTERLKKWKIPDPYGDDLSEYGRCAATINAEMKKLRVLWSPK